MTANVFAVMVVLLVGTTHAAMLRSKQLAARSLSASGLPDPHCRTGLISPKVSGKPQSCCPGYCGSCGDYKTCKNVRGQASENACCASKVYDMRCGNAPANVCLAKCSESVPPCIMDVDWDSMRTPKVKRVKGVPDCNEVVPVNRQHQQRAVNKGHMLVDLHKARAEIQQAQQTAEIAKTDLQRQSKDPEIPKSVLDKYQEESKRIDAALEEYEGDIHDMEKLKAKVEAINVRLGVPHELEVEFAGGKQHAEKDEKDAKQLKGEVFHLYGEGAGWIAEHFAKEAKELQDALDKEAAEARAAAAVAAAAKAEAEAAKKAAEEAEAAKKLEAERKAVEAAKQAAEAEAKKKKEEEDRKAAEAAAIKAAEEAAIKAAAVPASSAVGHAWNWCALDNNGSIICWHNGQVPVTPPKGTFRALAGTSGCYCAITASDSSLHCFGGNSYGMVSSSPQGLKVSSFAKSNTAPSDMCVIRQADSKLQCWGAMYTYGAERGLKHFERYFGSWTPERINWCPERPLSEKLPGFEGCMKSQDPGVPVHAAAIGYNGGCAILSKNKTVYCWGSNPTIFDRNFIGPNGWNAKPIVVLDTPANEKFKDITVTDFSACAIKESDSKLSCWGMGHYGVLNAPAEPMKRVRATQYTLCALKRSDSTVVCWGGGEDEKPLVSQAPTGIPFDDILIGYKVICGIKKDNKQFLCWGVDQYMKRLMTDKKPSFDPCCHD